MLVSGGMVATLLTGLGGVMTNYAWREAQWEELRSALRASVSAAGPLLAGAGSTTDAEIEERVGAFIESLLPRLDLDDVEVEHDTATGVTTVAVAGEYSFTHLWSDGPEDKESIEESVDVKLEVDHYEVALALDISSSMLQRMPSGTPGVNIVKLKALKQAMHAGFGVVETAVARDPGSVMVSVVPFGIAVNVADTCNPDPDTGACRADHSEDKERYVRMLVGPHGSTSALLQAARARDDHWVDTFHSYGAGVDLGPLAAQRLPDDLLNNLDWNLRRTGVAVDVSAQAPNLDTGAGPGLWVVDDEDFWNGCVMARWGHYWHEDARPAGWIPSDVGNWPARAEVAAWSPSAQVLPAATPIHLSDAPPDASNPNTLFTAYSWPDARIGKTADHRLQSVMYDVLGEDLSWLSLSATTQGDNDWSIADDRRGAGMCPPSPLKPLTEDVVALTAIVDELATVSKFGWAGGGLSANYLHLGIAWGLRTVSPLWRDTWEVEDTTGRERPSTPCAPGDAALNCESDLYKSIVLVTDGANRFGQASSRRQLDPLYSSGRNPGHIYQPLGGCRAPAPSYYAASGERTASAFDAHFAGYLEADGTFDPTQLAPVLDAFHRHGDPLPDTSATRALRSAALDAMTPWQIFRGYDAEGSIDTLLDDSHEFGFAGRPVQVHHLCGWSQVFGAYGRLDDVIRVGHSSTLPSTLLDPVEGAAPFELDFPYANYFPDIPTHFDSQLDDWLYEACKLAGQRRVRVHAIYLGPTGGTGREVATLQECVRQAGGDPNTDVWVTPTAAGLTAAFEEIFTVSRNLRFLN